MKKIILLILGLSCSLLIFGQVPNSFKYQAVARTTSGEILGNQNVSFRISILIGGTSGTALYTETHSVTTNQFGLVNIDIGKGSVIIGSIAGIDWGSDSHFLKVEMDRSGGSGYQYMGTSELLSVPYALHSSTVENDNTEDADADPENEIQVLSIQDDILSLSKGGGSVEISSTGGGDNWGSQTAVTDNTTLTGLGTESNPLQIMDGGVTSAKILDGSILSHDIADYMITSEKLVNNSVGTLKLEDRAVTGIKIAQAGATAGQVLKWDGSNWSPAADDAGGLSLPFEGTETYAGPVFSVTNMGSSGGIFSHSYGNYGIWGQSSHATGNAIYGLNTLSQGLGCGIRGEVLSSSGYSGHFSGGRFYIEGNTGIGTENPSTKLEVDGQVKITGGSPGAGKVLTSDASGLASWQSFGSGPWQQSGANLYYNDGNIGIGVANPAYKLEINGGSHSYIKFFNNNSGTGVEDGFVVGTTPTGNPAWIWNYENSNIHFGTNNINRMKINGNGLVDINGMLNLNSSVSSGVALKVHETEALWYNGTNFSWGYGADYNYFAKPIVIAAATDPGSNKLVVNGDAAKPGGGSWSTWSDVRLKDISGNFHKGLEEITRLLPVNYSYKEGNPVDLPDDRRYVGLVAQDVQKIFPEAVSEGAGGYLQLDMSPVNIALINAVKELKKENDDLKARLDRLELLLDAGN